MPTLSAGVRRSIERLGNGEPQGLGNGEPQGLRVSCATRMTELDAHANAWDALALESPHRLPMLTHAWVTAHLRTQLQAGQQWVCLFAFNGDTLVAVLPLVCEDRSLLGMKLSRLCTPSGDHTCSVDLLVAAGLERPVMKRFMSILAGIPSACVCLRLKALPETAPSLSFARELFGSRRCLTAEAGGASIIPTSGDWSAYEQTLSRSFRRNLRRLERRLADLPGQVVFVCGALSDQTLDALERFKEVEQHSWKGDRGTSIATHPPTEAFFRALIPALASKGWLQWHFLTLDKRPLAAQIHVRFGRSLTVFKIAYDPEFSSCSPGTLLLQRTLQQAFEDEHIDEVNLLTDYDWTRNWRPQTRAYRNMYLFPRRPLGLPPPCQIGLLARGASKRIPWLRRCSDGISDRLAAMWK